MREIQLNPDDQKAAEEMVHWKKRLKGTNPYCKNCGGTRGWFAIREGRDKAGNLVDRALQICCGELMDTEYSKLYDRMEQILSTVTAQNENLRLDIVSLRRHITDEIERNTLIGNIRRLARWVMKKLNHSQDLHA